MTVCFSSPVAMLPSSLPPRASPPLPPRPPSQMGICSPLWGRSHIGGSSKVPSRPRGGDHWQQLFIRYSFLTFTYSRCKCPFSPLSLPFKPFKPKEVEHAKLQ